MTIMADDNDSNLAQLRAKAERADALEAQMAQLLKQNAFRDAGLDISGGPGKLIFDTFQAGDQPVSAETVLAYAQQYGVAPTSATQEPVAPPPQPVTSNPPPSLSPQEVQHFEMVNAGNGSEPDPSSVPIGQRAWAEFDEVRKQGRPSDVAAIAGIGAIIGAAASGDKSALYDGQRMRDEAGYGR